MAAPPTFQEDANDFQSRLRRDLEELNSVYKRLELFPIASSEQQEESSSTLIRDLLTDAFSDEDLTTFCYDHFHEAYEAFTSGMSKIQKLQRLLEYCERQGKRETLLKLVKEHNPAQYAIFEKQQAA